MTAPITQEEWEAQRRVATEALPEIVDQVGLPEVLLPYQQRAVSLLDQASTQVLFIEKSRRIGLTWGLAAYAVLRAGRERAAGGMDVMYISYSQEMTREFIDACAMWARAFSTAARAAEEFLFDSGDEEGDRAIKAFRIQFASGFEIIALSSTPRGLRGKQGVVIIDEAAFVDSLETLIEAAMAFLMWGGQVVVCSTHYGVDNDFNATIQDMLAGRRPGKTLRIDLDDALRDGLYERICLVKGETWSAEGEAAWRQGIIDFYGASADQELFCVPAMGSGTWLSSPLIEARMTADAPILRLDLPADFLHRSELERAQLLAQLMDELEPTLDKLDQGLRYALGFDVGRVADLSVIPVLAIEKNLHRRLALCIELRGVPFAEQKMIVRTVMDALKGRVLGLAVDAVGIGANLAEDLGRLYGLREDEDGPGLVWAIKLSEEWYRLNMPPLKAAFEEDTIALSPDEDHLGDLRLVKIVRGIPRVPPIRTEEAGKTGKRRHGDFAVGLALSYFASRMRAVEFSYRPVNSRERPDWQKGPDDQPQSRSWWRPPLGARLRGSIR